MYKFWCFPIQFNFQLDTTKTKKNFKSKTFPITMQKLLKVLVFFFIVNQLHINSAAAQCSQVHACLHSGVFNPTLCRCDCLPSYSGIYCEIVSCTNTPYGCGVFITADQCTSTSIRDYCPGLCNSRGCACGIDQCLNGGVFDSATCKCTCPTGYRGLVCETASTCAVLVCQNSGTFNPTTCKCECFPNYSGNNCETLNCAVPDSNYCVYFSKSDCSSVSIVQSYCPNMCGRCSKSVI